jgi:hypothetical protein
MSRRLVTLVLALLLCALPATSWAKSPLVGTWRLVGTVGGDGQVVPVPAGFEQYKVVTPEYFMWTSLQDGAIVRHAGGAAFLDKRAYRERVDYTNGEDFRWFVGRTFEFTWKVADGRWYHRGVLRGDHGEEINVAEVWERVDHAPPPPARAGSGA